MRTLTLLGCLLTIVLVGCEPPRGSKAKGTATVATPAPASDAANPPPLNATGDGTATVPAGTTPATTSPETATQQPVGGGDSAVPTADSERVKAGVGVGIKGRSLDEYEGVVVTPAKTLFAAKERIAFEIEVPHALQLYEALEGQSPKDTDEFMEKVIKANNIRLPQLPPGHKYVYDPETKQLMVERPAKKK